jgi:hypothetical protein
MRYPASWHRATWREALPAGNGKIGIAVYGAVHDETIMLTHEDLWCNCNNQELPNVSSKLPEVRSSLFEGKVEESEYILIDALKENGYRHSLAWPLPLGDFKIGMQCSFAFKNYCRTLDMETGEINVSWQDGDIHYQRSQFVSRTDDLVVCRIVSSSRNAVNVELTLNIHDRRDRYKPFGEAEAKLPVDEETLAQDRYICYAAKNDDGTDFGAVARVVTEGGCLSYSWDKLKIENANIVTVYLKVFIKGKRSEKWLQLKNELAAVKESYNEQLKSHAEEHGKLFRSMTLEIQTENSTNNYAICVDNTSNEELLLEAYRGEASSVMIEKMWAFGRYLLISSSCKGGNPCPLIGLWCGEYEGLWSFNMANENIQMMYWHALTGNMPQLLLAVFDYYDRMMEDFRSNARNIYGCRGIYIPAVTTPGEGLLQCLSPHIIHWTGAAGWLAQHYYDYYLFTQDEKFLRERALPFLYETVLFYEDFFIQGDDGFYISVPSQSPENTPGNYLEEGQQDGIKTTINATMDFAIAKEVLTHLIEGAEIAGVYLNEVDKWKLMLTKIPPYQTNEDGAVSEWIHPFFKDNYHHRHLSHLYPVFPGTEVTKDEHSELFKAFLTAVKKRLAVGLNEQTSWSLAHMANIYARMGEGDMALECLDILSRSAVLNNFYTVCNDWRRMGISLDFQYAPVQLDANMGWTAAVNEMLLFSKPGFLSLLPALPSRWRKGSIIGLLCRGGIEADIKWDMEQGILQVVLESKKSQTIRLKFPYKVHRLSVQGASYATIKGDILDEFRLEEGIEMNLCINFLPFRYK